jgi:biopolymer transport protein TolR
MMSPARVRAKARMAMKRREEEVDDEERESGELNLVPYLDIVMNVMLFLLATVSSGLLLGNINTALPAYAADDRSVTAGTADEAEPPLQLAIAITQTKISLFSLSGQEGTLEAPRVEIAASKPAEEYDLGELTEAAAEIVARRWPDRGDRPDKSTEVILIPDPEIPYHVIVAVMDAVRATTDGQLLFPDVIFSSGAR